MTALTPEAVAQMVADREAGTPGPWHFDGPVWNQIVWTDSENRLCFMAHSDGMNDDRDIANARRIARLPDLEAAYLTLAAENATLRASEAAALERVKVLEKALKFYAGAWSFKTNKRYGGLEWFPSEKLLDDCGNVAKSALTPTADKE